LIFLQANEKGHLMTVNKKIIAAVTAAIGEFLLAAEQPQPLPAVEERREERVSGPVFSPWALAGRQSMMDMRRFLQMRLVR
jgi:hypothetical protein